jgi:large subunit ribosomal protein L24
MHVKIGDTVKIIAGREKGKVGEVTELFKHNSTVIVKDMNLKTKHVKPAREGELGEIRKVISQSHTMHITTFAALLLFNIIEEKSANFIEFLFSYYK